MRADENLPALLELECAIRASDESPRQAGTVFVHAILRDE
jgi:hypothetical protein